MLYFNCDYNRGAHPAILNALVEKNMEGLDGYGADRYCESAKEKIRAACECEEAEIWFVSGGTQTNQLVIDTALQKYEGVIAAQTGHINCHEGGAIEMTGHKVMALPQYEGKIKAEDLKQMLKTFYADGNHDHMTFPGMVYISHPTEYGTLYSKQELTDISEVCRAYNIPLFMDGARLIYALRSRYTDVTLPDIARLCDVFYIGGTKCGTLLGEAVVYTKKNMPKHFVTSVKQHGALLAKGFVMGIQFDALFTDDLWKQIGDNAIETADQLIELLKRKNVPFFLQSPTNQQFVVFENSALEELGKKVVYSYWEPVDDNHTAIRFATSWATTQEDLKQLEEILG